jgi:hypothetical protein
MLYRSILIALFSVFFICHCAQAQTIKGVWQKADSLQLIEEAVFAAASDQVAYYIGLDQGWKTTNGGMNWTPLTFPSEISVGPINIFAFGSTVILLQQRTDIPVPMIVRSTDEGATWQVANDSIMNDNIKSATMWSSTGMHIISLDGIGNGRSYHSTDGGATFTEGRTDTTLQKYIATSLSGTKRYSIAAAWSDSLNGVITLAPRNISNPPAHLLVTHDAGVNWKEVLLPKRNDTLPIPGKAYTIPGTSNFWVNVTDITLPGCYYLSTDFGETWRVSTTVGRPLEILAPVDTSLVWGLFSAFQYPELNQNKTYVNRGIDSSWWQTTGISGGGNNGRSINYFKFFSPTEGWATGTRVNATGTLYYYIYRFVQQSSVALRPMQPTFMFPMPASKTLRVQLASNVSIDRFVVTDVLGRDVSAHVVLLTQHDKESVLDISELPSGTYSLLLSAGGEMMSASTFIKE